MSKPILIPFAGEIRDFANSFPCTIMPTEDGASLAYDFDGKEVFEMHESSESAHARRLRINEDILRVKQGV